jgi:carboxylesterase type B
MEWVQEFIGGFGGDQNKVTISGCSAGGQSALIQYVSEGSWKYFTNAMAFSGPLGTVDK